MLGVAASYTLAAGVSGIPRNELICPDILPWHASCSYTGPFLPIPPMNKNFLRLLGLAMTCVSSAAWSIPLSTVESIDRLIASANLNNGGDTYVANWVSDQLGTSVVFGDKTECDAGCGWQSVTGTAATDLYAFDLTTSANWFLVKTGNGSSTGDRYFLFENIGSLDYGVFSLSQLGFSSNVTITKVSHVSEYGSTPVPEPATVALLGLGVLGLALGRKRKPTHA